MTFPAYEILDWAQTNWYWILLGWILLSLVLVPFIGRFAGLNTQEEIDLYGARAEDIVRPMSHSNSDTMRRISMDDPDWKDQIATIYDDHGGEG